tara:strand:- start:475 stop:2886 length:2412 start_codon:yes stop_codon:yes gene_type:complete
MNKINTNPNSAFPDQVVSDAEKATLDYGYQVGRAIEGEWFGSTRSNGNRFFSNWTSFHNLRLYARGEQSTQKYKDELSINGDLSYLNLDWKPVPVVSKFVDILVNGISEKRYEVKAFSQDPESIKKRTNYAANLMRDMAIKDELESIRAATGMNLFNSPSNIDLPETKEEVSLHMQLEYKPSIEIAEEELISNVFDKNKYELIKRRLVYDLAVLGIAASKTSWNKSNGVTLDYCDPAKMVWSYTEDPNFEDLYYVGEVKLMYLSEIKKQFPYLTNDELEQIQKYQGSNQYLMGWQEYNNDTIAVLFFEYKTYTNQVFKLKKGPFGLEKVIEKDDTFDPPENDNFKRVSRSIETLYTGAKILGYDNMLEWKLSENMTRPKSDTTRVNMNYAISAPRMYKGRIDSMVNRITGFADMINITNLKLQQVMSRIVPDGVYLDVDGLAEVDLGNGTSYNPQEALNMYFQTGSILGRSLTQDGDPNRGKVPIQELQSSGGQAKIGSLINTYQYYLQMIRDVTGLNEARDGSQPKEDMLVGLQKLAANASNVATRHILQSCLYLTAKLAENVSLRIADSIEFALTNTSLQNAISSYNVGTLEEVSELHLYDFGIYLQVEPEEEEKAQLEQNIQVALKTGGIDLEDAIDLRQINNIKLANQLLKQKRKKKIQREQQQKQANIQLQAQANAEASEKAAMAEVQKQQALTEEKVNIEKAKSQFEIERMQTEAQIKRELMQTEFNFNIQLAQVRANSEGTKEQEIEDRKDQRTKLQATQQSELIDQRKNNTLPKNFESSGNDSLGGFGLEQFEPR